MSRIMNGWAGGRGTGEQTDGKLGVTQPPSLETPPRRVACPPSLRISKRMLRPNSHPASPTEPGRERPGSGAGSRRGPRGQQRGRGQCPLAPGPLARAERPRPIARVRTPRAAHRPPRDPGGAAPFSASRPRLGAPLRGTLGWVRGGVGRRCTCGRGLLAPLPGSAASPAHLGAAKEEGPRGAGRRRGRGAGRHPALPWLPGPQGWESGASAALAGRERSRRRVQRLLLQTFLQGTSRNPARWGLRARRRPGLRAPAARCAPCRPGGGGTGSGRVSESLELLRKPRPPLRAFLLLLRASSALGVGHRAGRSPSASQCAPTPEREVGAPGSRAGQRGGRGAPRRREREAGRVAGCALGLHASSSVPRCTPVCPVLGAPVRRALSL